MYTQQAADNRHDDAYVFSGHHDVIFACFGARGMVCADVMFNAPLAWILAVRTFCTPKHTHTPLSTQRSMQVLILYSFQAIHQNK